MVIEDLRQLATAAAPGARLPSTRFLAERHGVGPVTVQSALRRLISEGIVETRPGSGTFVSWMAPAIERADRSWQAAALGSPRVNGEALATLCSPPPVDAVVLSYGYLPTDLQPLGLLRSATNRVARQAGGWEQVSAGGYADLRSWFAGQIAPGLAASDVVITPGGQSALSTACRALAGPGDPVVIESPTYVGAIAAARGADLRLVPWPVGLDGPDPEVLDDLLTSTGARLILAQPTFANPSGITWSQELRQRIMAVVTDHRAFLIEDDWAHDLAMTGATPPSLMQGDSGGHVVSIRSLTKSVAPGLRVGAMAARGAASTRLRNARVVDDLAVSGFLQRVAFEVVTHPAWPAHQRRVRRALRQGRDALCESVRNHLGPDALSLVPAGGLHLWVVLSSGVDDEEVAARSQAEGVIISPGRVWFPAEPTANCVRLSFSTCDAARFDEGVAVVAKFAGVSR